MTDFRTHAVVAFVLQINKETGETRIALRGRGVPEWLAVEYLTEALTHQIGRVIQRLAQERSQTDQQTDATLEQMWDLPPKEPPPSGQSRGDGAYF